MRTIVLSTLSAILLLSGPVARSDDDGIVAEGHGAQLRDLPARTYALYGGDGNAATSLVVFGQGATEILWLAMTFDDDITQGGTFAASGACERATLDPYAAPASLVKVTLSCGAREREGVFLLRES